MLGRTNSPSRSITSSTEPARPGSTRRSATVTISAPDAAIARSGRLHRAEAAGAHDQPRRPGAPAELEAGLAFLLLSSRSPSQPPCVALRTSIPWPSLSGVRPTPPAGRPRRPAPRPRPGSRARGAGQRDRVGHAGAGRRARPLAVQPDRHRAGSGRELADGSNGGDRRRAARRRPSRPRAGVGRHRGLEDAVAVVAGGEEQAVERARADERSVVGRGRAHPGARASTKLELRDVGQHAVGLAQQLVDAARGHPDVEAAAPPPSRRRRGARPRAARGRPARRPRAARTPARSASPRSVSTWPLTGRTAGRAAAGSQPSAPDQQPVARTIAAARCSWPSAVTTPRSAASLEDRLDDFRARADLAAGRLDGDL